MDRASVSRIEGWDSRPVAGGYVGLNELADDGFTGAVESDGTRLLMLNGRVVGVFDGTISAFAKGEATAYESPDPALPLLFAMRELGGEVRGKYYTDDTPIPEVDETLTSGGFTGYLELSENVLSGDYYVVYYGGRSLSAAFVGNESRVVTGKEALDLAADEVGIYEVRSVDLEVEDVPEPPEDAVATAGAADASPEEPDPAVDEVEDAERDDAIEEPEDESDGSTEVDATGASADADGEDPSDEAQDATDDDGPADGASTDSASPADDEPGVESIVEEAETEADDADREPRDADSGSEPPEPSTPAGASDGAPASGDRANAGDRGRTGSTKASPPNRPEQERSEPDERFEEEARWREARTVPALDPEESEQLVERPPPASPGEERTAGEEPSMEGAVAAEVEAFQERIDQLEAELESSERDRRRLNERLEDVVEDRDELEAERSALAQRIESLESRIERAEAAASSATESTAGRAEPSTGRSTVDPETALNQTDLFVRYGSKGKATLATAHDGRASAEEVAENLRVETHSRFDAATATVGGEPFDTFLEGTIQYRFVCWLVEELLYEIQETATEASLRDLYDVLPSLDRAEFNGTVTSRDEEGEERTETFDVVCRDRMGKPLVVANINDSLDPATGDMMARLVEDATSAAEAHESMGAAFLVTASFFEPDALETAADATRGGGFLSRDSKKSYVKLARTGGYHLCLVEARGDDFHVAVPEF